MLDEVEKAHPDVWNVFLQILDEGQVTDGKGRAINMKNTIIIMTSNIGSDIIANNSNNKNPDEINSLLHEELKKYFRIEFLNRIDDIIVYHSLNIEQIFDITKLMLKEVEKRLQEKNIKIIWNENLIQ